MTKTREKHDDAYAARWYQSDIPMPIIYDSKIVAWARRPATVITSTTGQTFKSNDPPPVGVDPDALAKFLIELRATRMLRKSCMLHASISQLLN